MRDTLTKEAPLILDSTCSYAHTARTSRWPAFASIRMDKRREVRPELVADARYLHFRSNIFDEIYCDPPHLFRKSNDITKIIRHIHSTNRVTPGAFQRYSFWNTHEQWYDFLEKINLEFARALKFSGKLHFKISDGDSNGLTKTSDLKRLTYFQELKKVEKSKSVFKTRVHFLSFRPKHALESFEEIQN